MNRSFQPRPSDGETPPSQWRTRHLAKLDKGD
jgi:hypothetical protein